MTRTGRGQAARRNGRCRPARPLAVPRRARISRSDASALAPRVSAPRRGHGSVARATPAATAPAPALPRIATNTGAAATGKLLASRTAVTVHSRCQRAPPSPPRSCASRFLCTADLQPQPCPPVATSARSLSPSSSPRALAPASDAPSAVQSCPTSTPSCCSTSFACASQPAFQSEFAVRALAGMRRARLRACADEACVTVLLLLLLLYASRSHPHRGMQTVRTDRPSFFLRAAHSLMDD